MKATIKIGLFFGLFVSLLNGWSWATSSDSFLTTIATQKDSVLNMYDAAYARVYNQFQQSGTALMKSTDYQSLVCLGVVDNAAFFQDLQNQLKTLKLDFLNKYSTILASATDLDQKQRIYDDTKVSLFTRGSYAKDLEALSSQYTKILNEQSQYAVTYQNAHQQKLASFIRDVTSYIAQNKDLLSKIDAKLSLLQNLDSAFDVLSQNMNAFRSRANSSQSLSLSNIDILKKSMISDLTTSLQTILDSELDKALSPETVSPLLAAQKTLVLSGFLSAFESKYNQLFSSSYDTNTYAHLQDRVLALHTKYYTAAGGYDCSAILPNPDFELELSILMKDIATFSSSLSRGSSVVVSGFQSSLNDMVSALQLEQKRIIASYKSYAEALASNQLTGNVALPSSTDSGSGLSLLTGVFPSFSTGADATIVVTKLGFKVRKGFRFTSPFKVNNSYYDVPVLQKLLKALGYYKGKIGTTYTKQTVSALYRFQLDRGLLKGYENMRQIWGWMGPLTQAALNAYLP